MYKTRADIKYVDFERYFELLNDSDESPESIAGIVMNVFYPNQPIRNTEKCIKEFSKAFDSPGKVQLKYKVDMSLKKASHFINCAETVKESPIDFLGFVIKHRVPFMKVNVNDISLETAQYAFSLFTNEPPK